MGTNVDTNIADAYRPLTDQEIEEDFTQLINEFFCDGPESDEHVLVNPHYTTDVGHQESEEHVVLAPVSPHNEARVGNYTTDAGQESEEHVLAPVSPSDEAEPDAAEAAEDEESTLPTLPRADVPVATTASGEAAPDAATASGSGFAADGRALRAENNAEQPTMGTSGSLFVAPGEASVEDGEPRPTGGAPDDDDESHVTGRKRYHHEIFDQETAWLRNQIHLDLTTGLVHGHMVRAAAQAKAITELREKTLLAFRVIALRREQLDQANREILVLEEKNRTTALELQAIRNNCSVMLGAFDAARNSLSVSAQAVEVDTRTPGGL